jgi:hypothetical protein
MNQCKVHVIRKKIALYPTITTINLPASSVDVQADANSATSRNVSLLCA